jgi:hypothetical protein
MRDTFDVDDTLLAIAVVACAIRVPVVEEYPEARAIREEIAPSNDPETPRNLAVWPAVAVGIVWIVILGVETVV